MGNYYEITAMILFGIGFTALLLQKNLIKKVIGMNIMDTAIFLYLTAKGFVIGRNVPILLPGMTTSANQYINPIPSGLVLTGIVVGVSVTAFTLSLCIKIYKTYGTLDIDKLALLSKSEGGEE